MRALTGLGAASGAAFGAASGGASGAASGEAMQRAQDRAAGARFKADAMDGLIAQGIATDPLDRRSAAEHELAALTATNAVESELKRLRSTL